MGEKFIEIILEADGRIADENTDEKSFMSRVKEKLSDDGLIDSVLDAISLAAGASTIAGVSGSTGAAATGVGAPAALAGLGITTIPAAISFIADAVNAARAAARGDYKRAALYILFMVPVIGDSLQLLKKTGMGDDVVKLVTNHFKMLKDAEKKRKVSSMALKFADAMSEKVPGAKGSKDEIKREIERIISGDGSGAESFTGEKQVAERKLANLYKGTLY